LTTHGADQRKPSRQDVHQTPSNLISPDPNHNPNPNPQSERSKTVGMPERFAQQALGHTSKAFVRAYSTKARVIVPSLEDYEAKIVPLPVAVNQ
jgi:hypothetical protein